MNGEWGFKAFKGMAVESSNLIRVYAREKRLPNSACVKNRRQASQRDGFGGLKGEALLRDHGSELCHDALERWFNTMDKTKIMGEGQVSAFASLYIQAQERRLCTPPRGILRMQRRGGVETATGVREPSFRGCAKYTNTHR